MQANGFTGLAGNAALENGLAYQNALANGVNSNALGTLPLFGEGAAPNSLHSASSALLQPIQGVIGRMCERRRNLSPFLRFSFRWT